MKRGNAATWAVRISWPLLAGAWGALVGFQGHLALPRNADSFGSLIATGYYGFFALTGLAAGLVLGALVGGLVELLVRRLGAPTAAALVVATITNALVCWQLAGMVEARYPGLRGPAGSGAAGSGPVSPTALPATGNGCAGPPPEDPRQRSLWEQECR